MAFRLYLPQEWVNDDARRKKAHVPKDTTFTSKPPIAPELIAAALAAGVPRGVVLADAVYGCGGAIHEWLTRMGLSYAAGVQSHVTVWPPGLEPLPAKEWSGRGRRPERLRRGAQHRPVSVEELALFLPASS